VLNQPSGNENHIRQRKSAERYRHTSEVLQTEQETSGRRALVATTEGPHLMNQTAGRQYSVRGRTTATALDWKSRSEWKNQHGQEDLSTQDFSVLTCGRLRKTKLKENFFGGKTTPWQRSSVRETRQRMAGKNQNLWVGNRTSGWDLGRKKTITGPEREPGRRALAKTELHKKTEPRGSREITKEKRGAQLISKTNFFIVIKIIIITDLWKSSSSLSHLIIRI
jgi:hypothetical protein